MFLEKLIVFQSLKKCSSLIFKYDASLLCSPELATVASEFVYSICLRCLEHSVASINKKLCVQIIEFCGYSILNEKYNFSKIIYLKDL
jgi:hypothetical protein